MVAASKALSVGRLVDVGVNLSPLAAQAQSLNSFLIVGSSITNPITYEEGYRSYDTLEAVGVDFDVFTPEYQAAEVWFSQDPQPTNVLIGRYSNKELKPTILGSPNPNFNRLQAITAGNFNVSTSIDTYFATGVSLAAPSDFAGMCGVLNGKVDSGNSNVKFTYDPTLSLFKVNNTSNGESDIGYLKYPERYIAFNGNLLGMVYGKQKNITFTIGSDINSTSTLTINFDSTGAELSTTFIGPSLKATLINLVNYFSTSTDAKFSLFNYRYYYENEQSGILYVEPKDSATGVYLKSSTPRCYTTGKTPLTATMVFLSTSTSDLTRVKVVDITNQTYKGIFIEDGKAPSEVCNQLKGDSFFNDNFTMILSPSSSFTSGLLNDNKVHYTGTISGGGLP